MIDIAAIREYTGADDAFIRKIFGQFLSHLDEDLAALASALTARSLPDVRKKAHAMLSSARIFHFTDIISLTERIEADCEAGRPENIGKDVPQLIRMYRQVSVEMEEWMNHLN
ncbi:MAG: Hpt domain-containing protein [Flavobacteriales bacterium]|nr:Hpt domain-containing protein [Flavobacteriales bacterium]